MTRREYDQLQQIADHLARGQTLDAKWGLLGLLSQARAEFAAEDAHHDAACIDRPINLGEAA